MSKIFEISYKSNGNDKIFNVDLSCITSIKLEKWYEGQGISGPFCQGGMIIISYKNKRSKDILSIDRYNNAQEIYNLFISNWKKFND